MHFDRVAVIGISGSGKSRFATELAALTGLPLLHGDQLEWLPNWTLRPERDLSALHASWIAEPRWIIEGWIDLERAIDPSATETDHIKGGTYERDARGTCAGGPRPCR